MSSITFEESKWIKASPEAIYQLLADYENGHPQILPKPYFTDLRVIKGGVGAGTEIEVDMVVMGVKRTMSMEVTEPQKGYILTETDHNNGITTSFIFDAVNGGCQLTIRTTMQFNDGVMGFIEKLTTPTITRNIYRKELQLIAEHVETTPIAI
ncbi:MAG: SRPBCC family protein [Chloroflexota bacterium]